MHKGRIRKRDVRRECIRLEDFPLDYQVSFWIRPKSRTRFHQIEDACGMVDRPFRFFPHFKIVPTADLLKRESLV
jgi:hypothetical protein